MTARGPVVVVALQLLVLLAVAGATVAKVRPWAIGDEAAHYDYVQTIAEDGRLPVITDRNHAAVRAIFYGTYPDPAPPRADEAPLIGHSYEAFQPPLYYLLATPAFLAGGDHRTTVRVVRAFDVGLLLVAAAALAALAVAMLGRRWPLGLAAGLSVLLWPGVVVRGVTIAPTALEIVVVTALVAVLWRVARDGGRRWVLAAGALVAACVLTKNTLVFVAPLYLVVLGLDLRRRRDVRATAGSLAIAAALVVPWLLFNLSAYDALTGAQAAQDQQHYVINPDFKDFTLADVGRALVHLPGDVLPGEFKRQFDVWWVQIADAVLVLMLAGGAVALLARSRDRRRLLVAGAPLACGIVILAAGMVASDWPTLTGRYLYAALPALAVGLAATAPPRVAWGGVLVASVLVGALWVDMAGAYYFTNVGAALGI